MTVPRPADEVIDELLAETERRYLEPTAGRRHAPVLIFMKAFPVFAALAPASGGSAPSR